VTVEGADVTFPSVLIDKDGFVVLHQVKDGKIVLPQSIGHTAVSAGTTEDVKVTADMALEEGGEYHAMIHYDTNGNGEYEFGEGSTDIDTQECVRTAPLMARCSKPAGCRQYGIQETSSALP
jgi:hypothetical protein